VRDPVGDHNDVIEIVLTDRLRKALTGIDVALVRDGQIAVLHTLLT